LLLYAALGFAALWLLIFEGPYPFAMVGSPDEDLSNTLPPKITLLALGVFQFGVLLSIEKPMGRLLSGLRIWAATVLINSMIMTLYLWHLTVMVIVVAIGYQLGGFGLGIEPGTSDWWLTRPIWILVLYACLLPVTLLFSPLERRSLPADAPVPGAPRLVVGAVLICLGVALLALFGVGNPPVQGLNVGSFVMVLVGSGLCGLLPRWR
jgi:hypothetical protein